MGRIQYISENRSVKKVIKGKLAEKRVEERPWRWSDNVNNDLEELGMRNLRMMELKNGNCKTIRLDDFRNV